MPTVKPALDQKFFTQLSSEDMTRLMKVSAAEGFDIRQTGRHAIRKYLKEFEQKNPSILEG